eukprot:8909044-Ditylum_brightwellii.AAC.1
MEQKVLKVIAGVAELIWSHHPSKSAVEVRSALEWSAAIYIHMVQMGSVWILFGVVVEFLLLGFDLLVLVQQFVICHGFHVALY